MFTRIALLALSLLALYSPSAHAETLRDSEITPPSVVSSKPLKLRRVGFAIHTEAVSYGVPTQDSLGSRLELAATFRLSRADAIRLHVGVGTELGQHTWHTDLPTHSMNFMGGYGFGGVVLTSKWRVPMSIGIRTEVGYTYLEQKIERVSFGNMLHLGVALWRPSNHPSAGLFAVAGIGYRLYFTGEGVTTAGFFAVTDIHINELLLTTLGLSYVW